LHIHIFFPSPPLPLFHWKLFFLWAGHLPPWHCSGRGKINKYVCREAHDPSRCHWNMARFRHCRTPRLCVFFARLKHQEIMFGVSGEEYSFDRKKNLTKVWNLYLFCILLFYHSSVNVTIALVLQVQQRRGSVDVLSWNKLRIIFRLRSN